jgi:hypothetical protein
MSQTSIARERRTHPAIEVMVEIGAIAAGVVDVPVVAAGAGVVTVAVDAAMADTVEAAGTKSDFWPWLQASALTFLATDFHGSIFEPRAVARLYFFANFGLRRVPPGLAKFGFGACGWFDSGGCTVHNSAQRRSEFDQDKK